MPTYLVGGAVRDQLLGLPVTERDFVVVGETPESMMARGFTPVGRDFPVFLHPETHEEYALARTERKSGRGYKGFTFYTDPTLSLEADLQRRDLTINAIAQAEDGTFIDPFHGIADLRAGILRHVSPAFSEDPVRLLRIARFAARFPTFTVHQDTLQRLREMVIQGEVDALVPERVVQELQKTFTTAEPGRFFAILAECNALSHIWPTFTWTAERAQAVSLLVQQHATAAQLAAVIFAQGSSAQQNAWMTRYHFPSHWGEYITLTARYYHARIQVTSDAETLLDFLQALDALRRAERAQHIWQVWDALLHTTSVTPLLATSILLKAQMLLNTIDTTPLQQQHLTGVAFKDALYQLRKQQLKQF